MRKAASRHRARQLKPQQLGLLSWQQGLWLRLVEDALSFHLGQPSLDQLSGYNNPAVTRYGVTTPDLLRSFRAYNDGKPYSKQVRPFGFMLMFQQEEGAEREQGPAKLRHKTPATMLRIISPFDRDPRKAARKAFDRDTGRKVSAKQLKTYAGVLRNYYAHPEAKFLNGDRAERGPTQRRHIVVRSVRHIGKEANRLDDQLAMGTDPSAQVEFGDGRDSLRLRMAAIKTAVKTFGPVAVAQAANISRQHLFAITQGTSAPSENILTRVEKSLSALRRERDQELATTMSAVIKLKKLAEQGGLRRLAATLEFSRGHLSRVISGIRPPSAKIVRGVLRLLTDDKTN